MIRETAYILGIISIMGSQACGDGDVTCRVKYTKAAAVITLEKSDSIYMNTLSKKAVKTWIKHCEDNNITVVVKGNIYAAGS